MYIILKVCRFAFVSSTSLESSLAMVSVINVKAKKITKNPVGYIRIQHISLNDSLPLNHR
jgi:hypothetical protein